MTNPITAAAETARRLSEVADQLPATVTQDEVRERLAEFDAAIAALSEPQRNWARTADDCFCPCCGARGAIGVCRSCSMG